jgi:chemotaxis protein CheD
MLTMTRRDLGIGDLEVASGDQELKTYALGSCVAVVAWDASIQAGGMIHIALPEARINPEKAAEKPGYFADTGLPVLFAGMARLGARRRTSWIKLIGGASFFDTNNLFDVGRRNLTAIYEYLAKQGFPVAAEDTGGTTSRTVSLVLPTGELTISNGIQRWNL